MDTKTLIDCLVARRQELGWSHEQVADLGKISKPALWFWENDVHLPRIDTFVRWAEALGVEVTLVYKRSE